MSKQPKAKLFSLRCLLMDFVRLTGALPGLIWLRPKRRYTSKQAKKRIRGAALLTISRRKATRRRRLCNASSSLLSCSQY